MDWLHATLLSVATFQDGFLFCLFLVLTITFIVFTTITDKKHTKSNSELIIARPVYSEPIIARAANGTAADIIRKVIRNLDLGWDYQTILQLTGSIYVSSKWQKHVRGVRKNLRKVLDRLE